MKSTAIDNSVRRVRLGLILSLAAVLSLSACTPAVCKDLQADIDAARSSLQATQAEIDRLQSAHAARVVQRDQHFDSMRAQATADGDTATAEGADWMSLVDGGVQIERTPFLAHEEHPTRIRAIPHAGLDGEWDGARLSGIRRRSTLDALGVKNGDIVHTVNGVLFSPNCLDGVQELLQTSDQLDILLSRRSGPVLLSFSLVDA